jgi:transcription elongation factor S-II
VWEFIVLNRYKTALRSRVFNLRDKKSQELRDNILTGVIRPERFAAMTSEEMASGEMKKLREMFTKESLNEYQLTTEAGTPTDMFKCGKCKKKDCTYRYVLEFT